MSRAKVAYKATYVCATDGCETRVSERDMHCCVPCWSPARKEHAPTCDWWDQQRAG